MENGGSCSPSPATPLSDWKNGIYTRMGAEVSALGTGTRDRDVCVCLCESSVCVCVWGGREPQPFARPPASNSLAMGLWLLTLIPGLAVQVAGPGAWSAPLRVKIKVVAGGGVSPEALRQHVQELKASARVMLRGRPRLDDALAEEEMQVDVDIRRTSLSGGEEEEGIVSSMAFDMAVGAMMSA